MKMLRILSLLFTIALVGNFLVACGDNADSNADADNNKTSSEEVQAGQPEDEVTFTLVNDTERPLTEFYVSPPEEEEWGDSLLQNADTLEPGEQAEVTITDGREGCDYDILGVLGEAPDGSVGEGELIQTGVEICDGTVYSYSTVE